MGRLKKKKNRAGRMSITFIVLILLAVMSIQILRLYEKDQAYIAREEELTEQMEEELLRQDELSDYEEYIGSRDYVEDTAKSKLGLVYDNEIIFKEK